MNKEELIHQIEKAFSGVILGTGIGLVEAQALDDYESEEVQAKYRENDEKTDWSLLSRHDLSQCYSSLSFFNANGMRFHLPAYMIESLKSDELDDPLFHLTSLDDYSLSKLTTLNDAQRQAIVFYLNWHIEQDNNNFEHPMIRRALKEYWDK